METIELRIHYFWWDLNNSKTGHTVLPAAQKENHFLMEYFTVFFTGPNMPFKFAFEDETNETVNMMFQSSMGCFGCFNCCWMTKDPEGCKFFVHHFWSLISNLPL